MDGAEAETGGQRIEGHADARGREDGKLAARAQPGVRERQPRMVQTVLTVPELLHKQNAHLVHKHALRLYFKYTRCKISMEFNFHLFKHSRWGFMEEVLRT